VEEVLVQNGPQEVTLRVLVQREQNPDLLIWQTKGGYAIFWPPVSWLRGRMSLVFGCVISDDLCPPVVRLGGNGISRDIDSQRLSHLGFAIRGICKIARMD
jgi:hypothetical protein